MDIEALSKLYGNEYDDGLDFNIPEPPDEDEGYFVLISGLVIISMLIILTVNI
jgi:hypothetical protein